MAVAVKVTLLPAVVAVLEEEPPSDGPAVMEGAAFTTKGEPLSPEPWEEEEQRELELLSQTKANQAWLPESEAVVV